MISETPDPQLPGRRFSARDTVLCIGIAALALIVLAGDGVRRAGEQMDDGVIRSVVLAVGHPTGWIADTLPFAAAADQVTGWLSADEDLGSDDGTFVGGGTPGADAPSEVPPTAFPADRPRPITSLLVTGDSLSQPLDAELARALSGAGVRTDRDAHIGTGISKTDLVDWGKLARQQSRRDHDAVIVFLGANEGFPMRRGTRNVECCSREWEAEYATRARAMMAAYRRGGRTQVYWLLVPTPRDAARQKIAAAVNAAVRVAAGPFGAEVRIIDTVAMFAAGGRYRDTLMLDGREQIVRESDGIHLNERGARHLADKVREQLAAVFALR